MSRGFFFLFAFIATALFYLAVESALPVSIKWVVKTLPIWILCIYAGLELTDFKGRLLLVGLVFGSFGDVALAIPFQNHFMAGIAFFLVGHLFYSVNFAKQFHFSILRMALATAVVILSIILTAWMLPSLGEMKLPLIVYILVITIMVVLSAFRIPPALYVFFGALSFLVSDALIAVNRFVEPIYGASFLVMSTYYTAQGLIAFGSIFDQKKY